MKKIITIILCVGMLFGCASSSITKKDVMNKCETIIRQMNTYDIGAFTLLTTNEETGKDGYQYYDCNVQYKSKNNNTIDMTITIDGMGLYMLSLEDSYYESSNTLFQELYTFYECFTLDYEFYNLIDIENSKISAYADHLNELLKLSKLIDNYSIENGNLMLNFMYTSSTVSLDFIITGKRQFN